MNEVLACALKSVLCSGLLSAYYWLFLRNKRLHTFNRCYLLIAVIASLVLPLLHFSLPGMPLPQNTTAYQLLEVMQGNGEEEVTAAKATPVYSWETVLIIFYGTIVLLMALMLAARIVWLYRLQYNGKRSLKHGYTLIHTENSKAPFSFFNFLFWKNGIDITSEEGRRILLHELVHIRQKHTLDKLLIQSVLVFFWFNPFYWLMQKELSMVHEFIADEGAIEDRDTESFARMLLQEYCGNTYPDIILPFFYSSTKRRLLMLNQSNKPRFAGIRRLMMLPLLGTAVLLFSFRTGEAPVTRAQKTIILALDAGHGGKDNGAVGINGIKEKDLALKITNRLAQMGAAYNVKVITLRSDDEYVSLQDRSAKANAFGADILVSIHINGSPELAEDHPRHPDGFEIMVAQRNRRYAESRELASAVAAQFNTLQLPARLTDKGLVVLRMADMPAILIECGYMDQAENVARITDNKQLDKLCGTILSGLVLYQNNRKK